MDIEATEDPVNNSWPNGGFKLGISLHFCMTSSMWQGGEGIGTVGLSDSVLRSLCAEAGFSEVRKIAIKHPLNSLYLITQKIGGWGGTAHRLMKQNSAPQRRPAQQIQPKACAPIPLIPR